MKALGQHIEAFFKKFFRVTDTIQVVCLSGIILNYIVMIILRVFGINYRAMEETVLLLAVWSYAIGAFTGTYEGEHIKADLIQTFIKSERAKGIHKLILDIVSLGVCLVLTLWIWDWIKWAIPMRARSTVYGYPLYWKYFATLAMYGFSVVFFIRSCILDIERIKNAGNKQAANDDNHEKGAEA